MAEDEVPCPDFDPHDPHWAYAILLVLSLVTTMALNSCGRGVYRCTTGLCSSGPMVKGFLPCAPGCAVMSFTGGERGHDRFSEQGAEVQIGPTPRSPPRSPGMRPCHLRSMRSALCVLVSMLMPVGAAEVQAPDPAANLSCGISGLAFVGELSFCEQGDRAGFGIPNVCDHGVVICAICAPLTTGTQSCLKETSPATSKGGTREPAGQKKDNRISRPDERKDTDADTRPPFRNLATDRVISGVEPCNANETSSYRAWPWPAPQCSLGPRPGDEGPRPGDECLDECLEHPVATDIRACEAVCKGTSHDYTWCSTSEIPLCTGSVQAVISAGSLAPTKYDAEGTPNDPKTSGVKESSENATRATCTPVGGYGRAHLMRAVRGLDVDEVTTLGGSGFVATRLLALHSGSRTLCAGSTPRADEPGVTPQLGLPLVRSPQPAPTSTRPGHVPSMPPSVRLPQPAASSTFAPFSTSETAKILQGALCGDDMHSGPDCFLGVGWHKSPHSTDGGIMTAANGKASTRRFLGKTTSDGAIESTRPTPPSPPPPASPPPRTPPRTPLPRTPLPRTPPRPSLPSPSLRCSAGLRVGETLGVDGASTLEARDISDTLCEELDETPTTWIGSWDPHSDHGGESVRGPDRAESGMRVRARHHFGGSEPPTDVPESSSPALDGAPRALAVSLLLPRTVPAGTGGYGMDGRVLPSPSIIIDIFSLATTARAMLVLLFCLLLLLLLDCPMLQARAAIPA